MVTKQILSGYDVATLEEFFELIFNNIDTDTAESRVLFNQLSVPQKCLDYADVFSVSSAYLNLKRIYTKTFGDSK